MVTDIQFEVFQPVKVLFGKGQLSKLADVVLPLGRRICLLTMPEIVKLGMAEKALDILKKSLLDVVLFDDVKPEPTCSHVDEVAIFVRDSKMDVLVALGGGSVIDVAKASAIRATHPEPTWMYVNLSNRAPLPIEAKTLPVVAIPTTAGTGSEVTPYAVMSNEETIQKGTIKSPYIFPRTAIVDPELTLNLPSNLTAATGIDAFSHALESYLNVANRTPFSDMVARESLNILYNNLPFAVENGNDINFRSHMAWGSLLAGYAIASAGTTVAHALAQPLGARAHIPHSITVAIFTLPVLHHTWRANVPLFAGLAKVLDRDRIVGLSEEKQAEAAVEMVEELLRKVGIYSKINEFVKDKDIVEKLLGDIMGYMSRPLKQHPKVFDEEEIRQIIEEAC